MRHAILQPPSASYANGLTTANLGAPDLALAHRQHNHYRTAVQACGVEVLYLDPDPAHPDACFVEDVAIVTERGFMLTRPGAPSRRGEVAAMATVLSQFQNQLPVIQAPGTLDGGDVCQADNHFWIGLSARTNEDGARQLGAWLTGLGYTHATVSMTGLKLLHLKSGMGFLGDGRLAMVDELKDNDAFRGYELVRVSPEESYVANCMRLNDHVLIAAGHPVFEASLRKLGYNVMPVDLTEYEKMDGGVSCLSLRW